MGSGWFEVEVEGGGAKGGVAAGHVVHPVRLVHDE